MREKKEKKNSKGLAERSDDGQNLWVEILGIPNLFFMRLLRPFCPVFTATPVRTERFELIPMKKWLAEGDWLNLMSLEAVLHLERNAINIVQFSDKSTKDFPAIFYTDGSKIDGRVGFAFVVFRSGVESENFQFRIRDECTVFVAELLCLNFAVKWITEQNSVISEYLICTDSLSSLDSLKCNSSSNNIIVEIQKQLKSLSDKNILIDFTFVRGYTGVLGNERADWLAKAATKRKIDIDVNIPKSFYKKITKERMVKSWNQEYLISNKGSITKKFFPPLIRDYHVIIFTLTTN
ncbi:RNase H domain-containing protein [Trichonephila clavipes]|nr:RNase H domain-containing protein [Trichonephila clavipes]